MLEQFHFLEPFWLLALIPLMLIFWLAFQGNTDSKSWAKVVDAKLLPLLLKGEDKNSNRFPKFLLAIAWLITVVALADPVWEKIPRPIFQTNSARVIVLDLSNSMLIDDLKPNRLARARFKIEDILSREEEGQTGLVLFAGEAFTASPLTRDTETIRSILKVLNPQIMPAQGSRADLGLIKAHDLLKQAGITSGQVLLIADGISKKSLGISAAKKLRDDGHTVSVMAVGTEVGGKLNFRNNTSVTVKLEAASLTEIADSGGGNYRLITTSGSDLKGLLSSISEGNSLNGDQNTLQNTQVDVDEDLQNREWKSTGPFLVLLLLPFAALAFRRGWLLNICAAFIILGLVAQPQEVFAEAPEPAIETQTNAQEQSQWQNAIEILSKNKSQRIDEAFTNKQYQKALELSGDPLTKGSAEYKLKNYENALTNFKQADGANARYNEGNTLAKLEKYEEAIAAYDEALILDSQMQDALDNKKTIEEFLKKQKESEENKDQKQDSDSESDSQQEDKDQKEGDSKQSNEDKEGSESEKNEKNEGDEDKEKSDKDSENQFSDANKDLENNKEKNEDEALQSAEDEKEADAKEKEEEQKGQLEQGEDQNKEPQDDPQNIQSKELADELSEEEKMAAEQWLRRIPDDPGGLLRRKFRHQYNQNRRNSKPTEEPW